MKQLNRVKGILFDKDGTLIEFEKFWHEVIKEVFFSLERAYDLDEDLVISLKQYSGVLEHGFKPESLIQYQSTSEIAKAWSLFLIEASEKIRLKYQGDSSACANDLYSLIDEISARGEFVAVSMPSAEVVLKRLKKEGFVLGIATADTKQSTIKSLKETGLLDYFDFLGCDDGTTLPKPNPNLGVAFEEAMRLKQGEYVMVGDSLSDYEFSKNCQIPFIGIRSHYGNLSDLKEDVQLIESLDELLEVFCE
ncbi:MAG: HAD family hydrolase [Campylobacterales bacterium]|nr:HAD family hydrolase [Campylobacterales bacterium]